MRMKFHPITILISIPFIIIAIPLCMLAFDLLVSCIFAKEPTSEDRRADIKSDFNIVIPQEWDCLYYNHGSLNGFDGCGTAYCVFAAPERDGEFFAEFSIVRDEEFEETVSSYKKHSFDGYSPIAPEYKYDLTQPYEWYFKMVEVENSVKVREIRIIYQAQRLYIFKNYYNNPVINGSETDKLERT